MNKEKVEAKLFKKIDNTYVEITKEQLIISLQEANKSLEQENQQLKKKYEDAVADYEYEKCKNSKAIEYIKDKLSSLKMNKEAIMRIVEPSNGHLLADVNYEIQKWERLLEILGDKE